VWTELDSADAIASFLGSIGGFHDACLREISVSGETFVGEDHAMRCPPGLDTSAFLYFQGGAGPIPAIELACRQVTGLRLTPSPEGCDSIIMGGEVTRADGALRLAVNFVAGPLRSTPDSWRFTAARTYENPDLEVRARSMAWRSLENGLGKQLRYRSQEHEGA
jgi:hypothetical protein